jgi:hypothetical protein
MAEVSRLATNWGTGSTYVGAGSTAAARSAQASDEGNATVSSPGTSARATTATWSSTG